MKRILLFGLPVLIIIAIVWFAVSHSRGVEKETSGIVTDAANAISEAWNPAELKDRAEPGLIKAMASQGQSVEQLFTIYATLGKRTKPMECAFKDSATLGNGDKEYTTVTYDCQGEFESGPATMLITVRRSKSEDEWQIYYIKVASEHFKE